MENSVREFNVFVQTTDKMFLGSAFAENAQMAKGRVLARFISQRHIQNLLEKNMEYSIVVEINDTKPILK
jgi:hypothetical protein